MNQDVDMKKLMSLEVDEETRVYIKQNKAAYRQLFKEMRESTIWAWIKKEQQNVETAQMVQDMCEREKVSLYIENNFSVLYIVTVFWPWRVKNLEHPI